MQESENTRVVTLEYQLTERFGLLLSQTQLADLLGRNIASLHCKSQLPERFKHACAQELRPQDRPSYVLPCLRGSQDHHW